MTQARDVQNEYIGIDLFRIVAALMVAAIHLHPFASISKGFSDVWDNAICRMAVPFFMITTGFFLKDKLESPREIWKYEKRMAGLYLIYSVFYLPQDILRYYQMDAAWKDKVRLFLKEWMITGSYAHLWYFLAVILAIAMLYVLVHVCGIRKCVLLPMAVGIYAVGVMGNGYYSFFKEMIEESPFLTWYFKVFETTKNGFFEGFLFLLVGNMLWDRKNVGRVWAKWTGFFLSLAGTVAERILLVKAGMQAESDLLIGPAFLAFFTFILLMDCREHQNADRRVGKISRALSMLLYGFHLLVLSYLSVLFRYRGITVNSLQYYGLVMGLTGATAAAILYLAESGKAELFKKLY